MNDYVDQFTGGLLNVASAYLPSLVVPDGNPSASNFLHLDCFKLPNLFRNRGIYPTATNGDRLPERFMWLRPDAYAAVIELEREWPACFYYSDMFRSPAESEAAVKSGRGALRAGRSTHNGGGALDNAVSKTRARLRAAGMVEMGKRKWKLDLDAMFRERGLYCFRTDGKIRKEHWHYNLGGAGYREGQLWMQRTFGDYYVHQMTKIHVQRMLAKVGLYQGELDGVNGPLTREAIRLFQRTWRLLRTGRADAKTRRVLAFVTSIKTPLAFPQAA